MNACRPIKTWYCNIFWSDHPIRRPNISLLFAFYLIGALQPLMGIHQNIKITMLRINFMCHILYYFVHPYMVHLFIRNGNGICGYPKIWFLASTSTWAHNLFVIWALGFLLRVILCSGAQGPSYFPKLFSSLHRVTIFLRMVTLFPLYSL